MPHQPYVNPITGQPFAPRLNIPEVFGKGMSYEDQILMLAAMLQDAIEKGDVALITQLNEAIADAKEAANSANETAKNVSTRLDKYAAANDSAVDMLRNDQKKVSTRLDKYAAANDSAVDMLRNDQKKLSSTVNKNSDAISALKANLGKKTALILGNSLTIGVGSSSGNNGLANLCRDMFEKQYVKASSGTGFMPYSGADHETTFIDLLKEANNDDSIPNNDITEIIINGAWGDSSYYTECGRSLSKYVANMKNAMANFYNLAKAHFPNATIKYFWCQGASLITQTTGAGKVNIFNLFVVHSYFPLMLAKAGIQYCGWPGWVTFMRNNLSGDNVHPNDAGYKALSTAWKQAYTGGLTYPAVTFTKNVTMSPLLEGLGDELMRFCITPEGFIVHSSGYASTSKVPDSPTYPVTNSVTDLDLSDVPIPISFDSFTYPDDSGKFYALFPVIWQSKSSAAYPMLGIFVNGATGPVLKIVCLANISGQKSDVMGGTFALRFDTSYIIGAGAAV